MRKRSLFLFAPLAGVAISALLTSGCQRQSQASTPPAAVKMETAPDAGTVEVDHPEQFPLVAAEARRVHDDLSVNGVISPDISLTVPVNSLSGGRVVEIRARLGDEVSKGQLLLRIHSPDLAQAIADYQKARADEILARRSLERAELLYSHGALAGKEREQAQDVEEKAKVDVRTTAERIRLLGGSTEELSPIIEVRAPAAGTIVAQNITGGAGVKSMDNSPDLFTIADLSRVWVVCDVYENNLAQVRVGDFAEVRLNAYPDRKLRGRVSNISSLLDPATRTAKVRLELDNPGRLMRPGMFASAVFVSQNTQTRLFVPTSAILRLHDKDWIFQPVGGKAFRRVEIQGGTASGDGAQEVLGGVRPGEQIVANALQFSSTADQK